MARHASPALAPTARRRRRRRAAVVVALYAAVAVVPAVAVGRSLTAQVQATTAQAVGRTAAAAPSTGAAVPTEPAVTATGGASARPPVSTPPPATDRDLRGWAGGLAPVVDIPAVALAAYGDAALDLAETEPGCGLSWPTLAGIGWLESDHGRTGGANLGADGRSSPLIFGVALDGTPGLAQIPDTDGGRLDGDPVHDRAVGPLQFIPETWRVWSADGDQDATVDVHDIDDAALAAARYLCAAGGDLTSAAGWTAAVFAYNHSGPYVDAVRAAANQYAERSLGA